MRRGDMAEQQSVKNMDLDHPILSHGVAERAVVLSPGDAITIRISPGMTPAARSIEWIGRAEAGWSSERAFGDFCRARLKESKAPRANGEVAQTAGLVRVMKLNKRWLVHAIDLAAWLELEAERQRQGVADEDAFTRKCREAGVVLKPASKRAKVGGRS